MERVTFDSDGWSIVGDFVVPQAKAPTAVVILLNKAAGDRAVYAGLADQLAGVGIASLRLDLRAHGESTNRGRFEPGAGTAILAGSEQDIVAAVRLVSSDSRIDRDRIGLVGASYSGEAMMEAARTAGFGTAYVALSPGSLSDASIAAIDREGVPFLLIVTRHERYLTEVVRAVRERSRSVEFLEMDGTEHATDILVAHPGVGELIAVWFRQQFQRDSRQQLGQAAQGCVDAETTDPEARFRLATCGSGALPAPSRLPAPDRQAGQPNGGDS